MKNETHAAMEPNVEANTYLPCKTSFYFIAMRHFYDP